MSSQAPEYAPRRDIRVAAIIAALASLLLMAGGYWQMRAEYERARNGTYQKLAGIGALKAGQIAYWVDEHRDHIMRVAGDPIFVRAESALSAGPMSAELQREVRERLRLEQRRDTDDMLLARPDGAVLASATEDPEGVDAVTQGAIETALATGNTALSAMYRCARGELHLDLVAPVTGTGGVPWAVLIMRGNVEHFLFPLIRGWPTPSPSAETFLLQQVGDEILVLNDLRHSSEPPLSVRFLMSHTDSPAVQAALGRRGIFEGRDYRGRVCVRKEGIMRRLFFSWHC